MPLASPEVWAAVRLRYQAGEGTIAEIANAFGVAERTLRDRANREGWKRHDSRRRRERPEAERRAALVARLFRSFERQLAELETRFGGEGGADEKNARTLAVLARTLETLNGLRDGAAKGEAEGDEPVDLDRLRATLAERLSGLDGGGSRPGDGDRQPR